MSGVALAVVPVPLAQQIVEALSAAFGGEIFATELAFCQPPRSF